MLGDLQCTYNVYMIGLAGTYNVYTNATQCIHNARLAIYSILLVMGCMICMESINVLSMYMYECMQYMNFMHDICIT